MSDKQKEPIPALIDRIGTEFVKIDAQIVTGLQVLLELHNVPAEVRLAVKEYTEDVVASLAEFTGNLVEMAQYVEPLNPAEHGHVSMAGLRAEIAADEAAGRREGAHAFKEILGTPQDPAVAPEGQEPQNDRGIER